MKTPTTQTTATAGMRSAIFHWEVYTYLQRKLWKKLRRKKHKILISHTIVVEENEKIKINIKN